MDYTIKLGVEIDTDGLQSKINAATGDLKPIKLDVEFNDVRKEIKSLTSELKTLNNKNNLKIGTSMVEKSLNDVASTIKDIKASIGTLDAGAGMSSLLSSINQISSAIERASGQFNSLNAELKALSSKDFNINLDINMGSSNNPIARNAAYGNKVRNETLPQLKKQAEALENYLKEYYKVADGFNAAQKLLQGTNAGSGKANLYDLLPKMLDGTGSLSNQMTAWKEYISLIKEAASIKNLDISNVTSQFSQSADKLVQDAQDIQTGAKETEQGFERLKQIFGSGSSGINAEGLTTQLDSIVADLGEIRTAVQSLSSNTSLDGLTASFNGLSETLEKLNANIALVQNNLSTGFSGVTSVGSGAIDNVKNASDASTAAVIQNEKRKQEAYKATAENVVYHAGVVVQSEEKKQQAVERTSDENKKILADSASTNISDGLKNADIKIEATEAQLKNLKTALSTIGFEKSSVDSIANDFEKLGITVKNVNSLLRDDGSVTLTVKGVDQYGDAITAINNISRDGSRSSWATAISKDFNETEQAFNRLKSLGKEISSLDIKIAGLDADKNKAEIETLITQLNRLEAEYNDLFNATENKFTNSQIDELVQDIVDGSNKINAVKDKLKANLADKIELNLGDNGNFETKVQEIESSVKRLSNVPDELEGNVRRLRDALTNMTTASEKGDIEGLISSYREYKNVLEEVENQSKQVKIAQQDAARAEKAVNDAAKLEQNKAKLSLQMQNWLKDNSAAAKEFGARIQELQRQLQSCDDIQLDGIKREFQNITQAAKLAGKTGQTFTDRIKTQFQKYSAYFGVAELFMYAEQGLRDMFEQVLSIDTAMTELKKVTNETDASYDQFLSNAASRSKEIGTTIDGLVSSTADFARLGYNFEDSQGLAEVANIYAVVGDEIDGVEGATESLISTMAAFKDSAVDMSNTDFAMSIVDKFNEIGELIA